MICTNEGERGVDNLQLYVTPKVVIKTLSVEQAFVGILLACWLVLASVICTDHSFPGVTLVYILTRVNRWQKGIDRIFELGWN